MFAGTECDRANLEQRTLLGSGRMSRHGAGIQLFHPLVDPWPLVTTAKYNVEAGGFSRFVQ